MRRVVGQVCAGLDIDDLGGGGEGTSVCGDAGFDVEATRDVSAREWNVMRRIGEVLVDFSFTAVDLLHVWDTRPRNDLYARGGRCIELVLALSVFLEGKNVSEIMEQKKG